MGSQHARGSQTFPRLRQAVPEGVWNGACGVTTWFKLEKSTHTPLNPEFCMHQTAINTTFVQQLVPGVRRKLPKLEGLTGMDTDQLIDIGIQVVANLEEVAKRKDVE